MRTTRRALVVAGALALALSGAACSEDEDDGTGGGGATSSTAAVTDDATTEDTGADGATSDDTAMEEGSTEAMVAGVAVIDSTAGEIVVLDGMPMYAFDRDTADSSSCVDDCAVAWPPVPADTEVPADLGLTTGELARADGTAQLTINGAPVYTFATDSPLATDGSGEPLGQGVGEVWWVVGSDGNPIRTIPGN